METQHTIAYGMQESNTSREVYSHQCPIKKVRKKSQIIHYHNDRDHVNSKKTKNKKQTKKKTPTKCHNVK